MLFPLIFIYHHQIVLKNILTSLKKIILTLYYLVGPAKVRKSWKDFYLLFDWSLESIYWLRSCIFFIHIIFCNDLQYEQVKNIFLLCIRKYGLCFLKNKTRTHCFALPHQLFFWKRCGDGRIQQCSVFRIPQQLRSRGTAKYRTSRIKHKAQSKRKHCRCKENTRGLKGKPWLFIIAKHAPKLIAQISMGNRKFDIPSN